MTAPLAEISVPQLERYAALIYKRTGITISPKKTALLSNRLRRRLRHTGQSSFEAYYDLISRLKDDDPEWDLFLQEITTHETYLFRDETQWTWLRQQWLPQIISEQRQGQRPAALRIWSAAASTGDEAMTIASCLAANVPNLDQWKIEILGTDIGVGALKEARQAIYGERAMRLVPEDYKVRFFKKLATANLWQAKPVLTELVTYKQHNLMEPLRAAAFDLVFLKNVLIYFDQASKQVVLRHVRAVIRPGGLLVAGGAEGISEQLRDFTQQQPWLFQAPEKQKA